MHRASLTIFNITTALCPNNELLDASEIEWFNDPDDEQPIPVAHPVVPATSRRSTRVPQPSAHIRDTSNAAYPTTQLLKESNKLLCK
jgi:hypothetical protein